MPLGVLEGSELVHLIDVGLVATVDGQQFEGSALLDAVSVGLEGVVEEVEVVPGSEAVLLDGVGLGVVDSHLEIGVVLGDEESTSSLGSVVFHHDGFLDLPGVGDETGHGGSGGGDPLPLENPVGLPGQHTAVPVGGDLEVLEGLGAHVLHERAVGDDDCILVLQLACTLAHVVVIGICDELVGLGKRERVVDTLVVLGNETDGLETHLACAVEDLE